MTLQEMYQLIDKLSADEMRQLQEYIEQRQREEARERARAFMEAVEEMREGLTEEQLAQIEWAINYKYVEPPDDEMWSE
jgi:hypothetical protein